jgi:hypothetical protein
MVFDLIAGETQERSWSVLKRGGILVSTLAQLSKQKAAERGARGMRYTAEESGADLSEIAKLIDAGQVKPVIAKVFPLAQAMQAQQFLETGHAAGMLGCQLLDQPPHTLRGGINFTKVPDLSVSARGRDCHRVPQLRHVDPDENFPDHRHSRKRCSGSTLLESR